MRGIYEGYVGWFDMKPATIYETPVTAIYPDLIKLAGGAGAIVRLAQSRSESDNSTEALHLAEMVLTTDAQHQGVLAAKLKALEALLSRCRNSNERGWLDHSRHTKWHEEGAAKGGNSALKALSFLRRSFSLSLYLPGRLGREARLFSPG